MIRIVIRLIRAIGTLLGFTYTLQYRSDMGLYLAIPLMSVFLLETLGQTWCLCVETCRETCDTAYSSSLSSGTHVEVDSIMYIQPHAHITYPPFQILGPTTSDTWTLVGCVYVDVMSWVIDLLLPTAVMGGALGIFQLMERMGHKDVGLWWMVPLAVAGWVGLIALVICRLLLFGHVSVLDRLLVDRRDLVSTHPSALSRTPLPPQPCHVEKATDATVVVERLLPTQEDSQMFDVA